MSKEEYTEITIRVPKSLVNLLETENFLGWDRQDFFESAIRSLICISATHMESDDERKFHKKYGRDVGVIYLPKSLDC